MAQVSPCLMTTGHSSLLSSSTDFIPISFEAITNSSKGMLGKHHLHTEWLMLFFNSGGNALNARAKLGRASEPAAPSAIVFKACLRDSVIDLGSEVQAKILSAKTQVSFCIDLENKKLRIDVQPGVSKKLSTITMRL